MVVLFPSDTTLSIPPAKQQALFLKPSLSAGFLGLLRVGFPQKKPWATGGFSEQVAVMLRAWVAAGHLPNLGFSWMSRLFRGPNS